MPIDWATDWTKARHGINEVVIVNEEDYDQEEECYVRVGDYYQCFVLLKLKNIELHVFSSKHCLKIEMELTRSLSSMRKIMTGKKRRRIGEIMKTMILILSIGCFFDTYTRRLPWSFNLLLDVFPVLCHIV